MEDEKQLGFGDYLWYLQRFFLYNMVAFLFGMYIGYRYRIRLCILVRTATRFFRQEITMEFHRQQSEHMFREGILQEAREQEVRDRRSGRDLLLRAQMWSAPGGEWRYEGRALFPDQPLRPAVPDRQLEPQLQNEGENARRENMANDADYEWIGDWTTDWEPELQRMREYRVLVGSGDAESGEEYFTGKFSSWLLQEISLRGQSQKLEVKNIETNES